MRAAAASAPRYRRAHHGVGPVELDVVGVVLLAFHDAVAVGVPVHPGVFERALHAGPELAQPGVARAQPPLAVDLHDAAHLAVRGGVSLVSALAQRHRGAEAHAAVRTHVGEEVDFPHAAFQVRIEVRHGLLVVVDVRAVHGAAAAVVVAALERQRLAAFQHHHGVGADDGSLAGYGVQHGRGQGGRPQRVAIALRALAQ